MILEIALLLLSFIIWTCICLLLNIWSARRIGIPVVWSPVRPENPVWLMCNQRLAPLLRKLPLSEWTNHSTLDWTWTDRLRGSIMHKKLGKTFAHATPGKIEVFTADAAVVHQVFTARGDFRKQCDSAKVLDLYGPSLVTVSGDTWTRHRRITTKAFGEKSNRLVWEESMRQANQMIEFWVKTDSGANTVAEDSLELSLHVLTSAAFGLRYDFHGSTEAHLPNGHQRSYKKCLHSVLQLQNVLLLYFIPEFVFRLPLMPKRLVEVHDCSRELKQYLVELAKSDTGPTELGSERGNNLLTSLIWENKMAKSGGISDDEVYGNLFSWAFGGHETSANTFTHALFLLAAFPDVQDWLIEEINSVELGYDSFPCMKRCLAVMFETLRLFPTVTIAPKTTGDSAASVRSEEGLIYSLPPGADVVANIPTLHVHRDYWGDDALLWKPSRWIDGDEDEKLRTPVKGSFIPWTDGPRVCPGKKFAQVTFVATVATLLSQYKIDVVAHHGEDPGRARERAWKAAEDSRAALTLILRAPESVSFRLVRRV